MTLTVGDRSLRAMVVLASPDGHSLALMYDGMLAGFVSMMPVMWQSGEYRTLTNVPVTIDPAPPRGAHVTH